jgi:hypothetical protein
MVGVFRMLELAACTYTCTTDVKMADEHKLGRSNVTPVNLQRIQACFEDLGNYIPTLSVALWEGSCAIKYKRSRNTLE